MPQIRIWNDNTVPYKELFGDDQINILPGKFIDMEADDGIRFLGTYNQPKFDGMGNPTTESLKMLRKEIIEPLFDDGTMMPKHDGELTCTVCGKVCVDQEHLDGHINANHLDAMADKNEQAKRLKGKRR